MIKFKLHFGGDPDHDSSLAGDLHSSCVSSRL